MVWVIGLLSNLLSATAQTCKTGVDGRVWFQYSSHQVGEVDGLGLTTFAITNFPTYYDSSTSALPGSPVANNTQRMTHFCGLSGVNFWDDKFYSELKSCVISGISSLALTGNDEYPDASTTDGRDRTTKCYADCLGINMVGNTPPWTVNLTTTFPVNTFSGDVIANAATGGSYQALVPWRNNNSICWLVQVGMKDVYNQDDLLICEIIQSSNGYWTLRTFTSGSTDATRLQSCRAQCIAFQTPDNSPPQQIAFSNYRAVATSGAAAGVTPMTPTNSSICLLTKTWLRDQAVHDTRMQCLISDLNGVHTLTSITSAPNPGSGNLINDCAAVCISWDNNVAECSSENTCQAGCTPNSATTISLRTATTYLYRPSSQSNLQSSVATTIPVALGHSCTCGVQTCNASYGLFLDHTYPNCLDDVDECKLKTSKCAPSANCTNIDRTNLTFSAYQDGFSCSCTGNKVLVNLYYCADLLSVSYGTATVSGSRVTLFWSEPTNNPSVASFKLSIWPASNPGNRVVITMDKSETSITLSNIVGPVQPLTTYNYIVELVMSNNADPNTYILASPVAQSITTPCSCDDQPANAIGNYSDSPAQISITQNLGAITLKFTQKSVCQSLLNVNTSLGYTTTFALPTPGCNKQNTLALTLSDLRLPTAKPVVIMLAAAQASGTTSLPQSVNFTAKWYGAISIQVQSVSGFSVPNSRAHIVSSMPSLAVNESDTIPSTFLKYFTDPSGTLSGPQNFTINMSNDFGVHTYTTGGFMTVSVPENGTGSAFFTDTTTHLTTGYVITPDNWPNLASTGSACGIMSVNVCADAAGVTACTMTDESGYYALSAPILTRVKVYIQPQPDRWFNASAVSTLVGGNVIAPLATGGSYVYNGTTPNNADVNGLNFTESPYVNIGHWLSLSATIGTCGLNAGSQVVDLTADQGCFSAIGYAFTLSGALRLPSVKWTATLKQFTEFADTNYAVPANNFFAATALQQFDLGGQNQSVAWTYRGYPDVQLSLPASTSCNTTVNVLRVGVQATLSLTAQEMFTGITTTHYCPGYSEPVMVKDDLNSGLCSGGGNPLWGLTTTCTLSNLTQSMSSTITPLVAGGGALHMALTFLQRPGDAVTRPAITVQLTAYVTGIQLSSAATTAIVNSNFTGVIKMVALGPQFAPFFALCAPPGAHSLLSVGDGTQLQRTFAPNTAMSTLYPLSMPGTFPTSLSGSWGAVTVSKQYTQTPTLPATVALWKTLSNDLLSNNMWTQQYSLKAQSIGAGEPDMVFLPAQSVLATDATVYTFNWPTCVMNNAKSILAFEPLVADATQLAWTPASLADGNTLTALNTAVPQDDAVAWNNPPSFPQLTVYGDGVGVLQIPTNRTQIASISDTTVSTPAGSRTLSVTEIITGEVSGVTTLNLAPTNAQDRLDLHVRRDPVFGTPVVNMTSGLTACPYIPNTIHRNSFNVMLDGKSDRRARPVPSITWERVTIEIINKALSGAEYTLDVANTNGLRLYYDDNTAFTRTTLAIPAASTIVVKLRAYIALSGALQYPNVTFTVTDTCDPTFTNNVVLSLSFMTLCPVARWSGQMAQLQAANADWIINKASNSVLNISVENADTTRTFAQYGASPTIILQYLASDPSATWTTAATLLSSTVGDPNQSVLSGAFKVNKTFVGSYYLRVASICSSGGSFSSSLPGIVDQSPPSSTARSPSPNAYYWPGMDISITFNDVMCAPSNTPTVKAATITPSNTATDLLQYCKGNALAFQFDASQDFESTLGKHFNIDIPAFTDEAGNPSGDTSFTFLVGTTDSTGAIIPKISNLQATLQGVYYTGYTNQNQLTSDFVSAFATLTNAAPTRFAITSQSPQPSVPGSGTFSVVITSQQTAVKVAAGSSGTIPPASATPATATSLAKQIGVALLAHSSTSGPLSQLPSQRVVLSLIAEEDNPIIVGPTKPPTPFATGQPVQKKSQTALIVGLTVPFGILFIVIVLIATFFILKKTGSAPGLVNSVESCCCKTGKATSTDDTAKGVELTNKSDTAAVPVVVASNKDNG